MVLQWFNTTGHQAVGPYYVHTAFWASSPVLSCAVILRSRSLDPLSFCCIPPTPTCCFWLPAFDRVSWSPSRLSADNTQTVCVTAAQEQRLWLCYIMMITGRPLTERTPAEHCKDRYPLVYHWRRMQVMKQSRVSTRISFHLRNDAR